MKNMIINTCLRCKSRSRHVRGRSASPRPRPDNKFAKELQKVPQNVAQGFEWKRSLVTPGRARRTVNR